ncbi:MAG: heme exporter protein CcmB [Bacteroidales bacterium]|nr:heme exporter protein CcmB [Bacteroidales bacterium]MBK7175019.1 heme exporter protein CcmB [Bacteroidales bacterium]
MVHEIKHLVAKDVSLELKQRYAFNGILLYVVSTIFVCYLSFTGVIDPETWNALFWIIMLFAAVNAVSKSFVQESIQRQLYYYTLASPQSIILSKVIYNTMLMGVLSALCILVFTALMGSFIHSYGVFMLALALGSFGFSSVLTMIAAIASRTSNNFALMAILSFPIMLPFLLLLMNVSSSALSNGTIADNATYLLALFLLDAVVVALSFVLFPYLWRD